MYNVTSVKEAGAIVAALEDIKNAMEGGYPEPTTATSGQVLTADGEGGASWEDASGVDMTGAQAGQVLTAIQDMGGNLIQGWTTPDSGGGQSATLAKSDATYDDKAGVYFWQIPTIEYASVISANVISLTEYTSYISQISGVKQISDFTISDYGSGSGISISVSSTVYTNITGDTLKFGIA